MTWQVSMKNKDGLRFEIFVKPTLDEQPYEAAVRAANEHPEHGPLGPWTAGDCRRA
jgi:hypothetical protein